MFSFVKKSLPKMKWGTRLAYIILIERRSLLRYGTFGNVTEFLCNESTPISIVMCQLIKNKQVFYAIIYRRIWPINCTLI